MPPRVPAASPEGAAATRAGGIPFEFQGQNFIALPFDYFLRQKGGAALSMTQQLLVRDRPIQCDGSLANSSALAARARRRLRTFDVVGVTECTRRYWRVLGSRLGWSNLVDETIMDAAEKREHNEWYKPKGTEVTPELRKFLEAQAERAAVMKVVKEKAAASLSAKRVASQMKALTTGANAPNFDISDKVEILPSEKGSRAVPNPDPPADHDTAVCTRTCGR